MKPRTLSEGTLSAQAICKDIALANALLSYTAARQPMPAVRPKADKIVMRACAAGACALAAMGAAGVLP